MDQSKTLTSKYKQALKRPKSILVMYIQVEGIYLYEFLDDFEMFHVKYQQRFDLEESITDSIMHALTQYSQKSSNKKKSLVYMVIDDYFLFTNRVVLSDVQLQDPIQAIEIELDDLSEHEWTYSIAPKEAQGKHVFLIYGIKKPLLKQIESGVRKQKFFLRKMLTRFHCFKELVASDLLKIEPSRLNVLVDIGKVRVRVYFVINNQLKMYRRFNLRLDNSDKKLTFPAIFDSIQVFLNSCIDSYIARYTNHTVNGIYFYSDFYDIPSKFDKFSVKDCSLEKLGIYSDKVNCEDGDLLDTFLILYGVYLEKTNKKGFNLIPFLKRFERIGYYAIGLLGVVLFAYTTLWGVTTYFSLNEEYAKYADDVMLQKKEKKSRKKDIVDLRSHIMEQQKIVNYADLTSEAFMNRLPVADFLYQISVLASSDMNFQMMSIRRDKVIITGESSSMNGNYSFYMFIQKLQTIDYLQDIKYTLGLSASVNRSSFTINLGWKTDA